MRKTRLLLSLNRFYPEVGGAETNLYFQANKLAEKYDVTVFTPQRIGNPARESLNGYRVRRFFDLLNPLRRKPNLKTKTLCPTMALSVLFGERYDAVLCFPAMSWNNMLVFIAAKLRGIPVVLCSFDMIDYAKIIERDGTIDPHLLTDYQLPKKEALFLRNLDQVFAISNREIAVYKRYNANVAYSPVPILTEEYTAHTPNPRERYGIAADDFVFLALGRVSTIKGQDIALDGFIKVAAQLTNAKLVMVGREDYEPELIKAMREKIAKHRLESRVTFTGMVEREEVIGWLQHSDIHVIPVRFMNSGAVVVESWAAGTPVIQSDAVDPNLVVEQQNGYLFPTGDADALAQKMTTAYNDRANLPQMGETGKDLVMREYTYDSLIEIYDNAIEQIRIKRASPYKTDERRA